jgi:hypothetical protein
LKKYLDMLGTLLDQLEVQKIGFLDIRIKVEKPNQMSETGEPTPITHGLSIACFKTLIDISLIMFSYLLME